MSARPAIGPLIGSGRVAEVFSYGANVLKLYLSPGAKADALREAAAMALAEARGLPVPKALEVGTFDGRWGIVMTRAPGDTLAAYAEADPSRLTASIEEMVRLHLEMHAQREVRLPSLKARLAARIALADELSPARRDALVVGLRDMPEGDSICHGDFHPFNIIGVPGAATIVDWLDATCGPPAADACRSYVLVAPHFPDLAEAYLDRYATASGLDRGAILQWLPFVASARLAEGTPDTPYLLGLLEGAT